MNITISPNVHLHIGILQLANCQITSSSPELRDHCLNVYRELHQHFTTQPLNTDVTVLAVRQLFRSVGIDPSRYRPSSEALLRRILKTQTLPWINNLVDINNLCSATAALPIGAYDAKKIIGDTITVRLAQPGEQYAGVAKQYDIVGKIVLADSAGPFGAPIGDSARTQIQTDTTTALVVIFAPYTAAGETALRKTVERFSQLAKQYTQAEVTESYCL